MGYWLMKSEPDEFGIEDLIRSDKQTTTWSGVRNFQARNFMRDDMKLGDLAFFYHSSCPAPGVVGTMKVVKAAYPDPTQFDPASDYFDPKSKPDNPTWVAVDLQFVKQFPLVSLEALRKEPKLAEMRLLQKGNRLSVLPVNAAEWKRIMSMVEG
ncbi:Predicted RNA-binding protein, contains PUA-like domain [Hydrocarboniphaga daqingensis]|uniref:Predicted RNA-binding protein, contains PUA-like domain n=1 Tax=Hydrocarboniphaga daqingensis TaxID=490188 RepID=A0A1M5REP2_9GAMM|nr:EVE domain-containing protein [Hydrocarboniphaga daqingensis]SHH24546.1 Predicted RNA-binding protein, contains PUA-like domain [Hydrocarboniphaga daqingensis]